jgi:hypothetical protein
MNHHEYERYTKAVLKEDIFLNDNDLLSLAIGPLNLEGEKAQISKILENCFDNLRSFTKSYD